MKALLTVEELSQYLQKSASSIRSDATRNPRALPPICRLPGTKRLLWRAEDVEQWIAEHVAGATETPAAVFEPQARKSKRGRPTKAEQLARRRQAQGAAATHVSSARG